MRTLLLVFLIIAWAVGQAQNAPQEEQVDASFPGGLPAFEKFVIKEMKFPKTEKSYPGDGNVWISFDVRKNGKIANIEIEKSLNKTLDDEAIRIVKNFPKWLPATQNNKPILMNVVVSISFFDTYE